MKKACRWVPAYLLVVALTIAAAVGYSRTVDVIAENTPVSRSTVLILDAGHGGEDGGAVSCTGVYESRINLEITLRLDDLMHLLGYDTRMIRTDDRSVYTKGDTLAQKKISDLKERVRIANSTQNAFLLSIHQNNFPEGKYDGSQVFYDEQGRGGALAEALQGALSRCFDPDSHRSCKKSKGVYLMKHIQCPGVLIECGFLSNVREEALLRSPEYQKKLCCVIGATVGSYLEEQNRIAA